MTTHDTTVEQRLHKLERQNRWFKLLLVCAGAILLAGAQRDTPKTITAEEFVVVDEGGNTRARLSARARGLELFDSGQNLRVSLRESGHPSHGTILFGIKDSAEPYVELGGSVGREGFGLTVRRTARRPEVVLRSRPGQSEFFLRTQEQEAGFVCQSAGSALTLPGIWLGRHGGKSSLSLKNPLAGPRKGNHYGIALGCSQDNASLEMDVDTESSNGVLVALGLDRDRGGFVKVDGQEPLSVHKDYSGERRGKPEPDNE